MQDLFEFALLLTSIVIRFRWTYGASPQLEWWNNGIVEWWV